MQTLIAIAIVVGSAVLATACKTVECGEGTIEREGACVASDQSVDPATCGPFTELVAGKCVPVFPPTVCDTASTQGELDELGVTTCIGTGAGFACPQPAAGKQTICGQLYDLETGQPFSDGAECMACPATPPATGPCSIAIRAFDAIMFATNPQTATPLETGPVEIDTCGRFKVPDITVPSGPFIGLGIDDAAAAAAGPPGTTNSVGISIFKLPDTATKDVEGFIAKKSTTDAWTASGGPPITGGMFVGIFRAASTGFANQAGVTVTRNGSTIAADDHYFQAAQTTRTTIDMAATATGANGTVVVTNARLGEMYGAQQGPLPAECRWSTSAGVSLPFIVFVQIFRPVDASPATCNL